MHSDALERLSSVMRKKTLTLSLAESCTGGMLSSAITGKHGSSEFFLGSVIAYSNASKEMILGVDHDTLVSFGAVSKEAAKDMAMGVKRIFDSDIAASVTGIAGPTGGSVLKPVGTVFTAVTDGNITNVTEHHFTGSRKEIQKASSDAVIYMILEMIE